MKNTKSRKKILLSSIAMLLVALVALGSATYAWFTFNKTVKATGMQVTVAAQKGLVITTKNGAADSNTNWGTNEAFAAASVADLSPASLAYTATAMPAKTVYNTNLTADGKWLGKNASEVTAAWAEVDTVEPVTTANTEAFAKDGYVAVYRVGVKSKDGTALSSVSMKVTPTVDNGSACADYMRLAIVKEGTTNAVRAYGNEDSPKAFETAAKAGTQTGSDVTLTAGLTSGTPINSVFTIDSLTTPVFFDIYVWFEGEDEDCTSANANGTFSIQVDFAAA